MFLVSAVLSCDEEAIAQQPVTPIYGTTASELFGSSIAGGSDFNNDSKPDYIVGSPYYQSSANVFSGRVTLLANDGSVIRTVAPTSPPNYQRFGASLVIVGRIDNDTVDDFVVGAPGDCSYSPTPYVAAYSGATGARLWITTAGSGTEYGDRLSVVQDLDSDGVPDVVVGAPTYATDSSQTTGRCNTGKGQVQVLSGKTGTPIWTISGTTFGHRLGYDVAGIPDVTGDAVPDFAALLPGSSFNTNIMVYSGSSGSLWKTVAANHSNVLSAFRDFNADGLADVLTGDASASLSTSAYEGALRVISLAGSGSTLATV